MKNFLALIFGAAVLFSCEKTSEQAPATQNTEAATSLEQDARVLKNEKGETLTLVYFAEGDRVAVRVKKDSGPEHKLSAKGTNDRGEPVFTDGTYIWEMKEDGQSGTFTGENGVAELYRP